MLLFLYIFCSIFRVELVKNEKFLTPASLYCFNIYLLFSFYSRIEFNYYYYCCVLLQVSDLKIKFSTVSKISYAKKKEEKINQQ